jgi:hypothetical protein
MYEMAKLRNQRARLVFTQLGCVAIIVYIGQLAAASHAMYDRTYSNGADFIFALSFTAVLAALVLLILSARSFVLVQRKLRALYHQED